MRALPTSRLVVKAKPFACVSVQKRFLTAMAHEGIASWRVDVRPLADSTAKHLGTYGDVDVALDTFPYGGTTTTCEALWSGVPVVTLTGNCHAHNVGRSLLKTVGLETQCVADSAAQYIAKCVALASDHAALNALRMSLRGWMTSPGGLCNGEAFAGKLERAYVELWRNHCDGATAAR